MYTNNNLVLNNLVHKFKLLAVLCLQFICVFGILFFYCSGFLEIQTKQIQLDIYLRFYFKFGSESFWKLPKMGIEILFH